MLKMGKKFKEGNKTPAGAADLIQGWETHFADCMPSNERIAQLLEPEHGLPTISDFLSIFESPVDVRMESESIWPPERAIVY